MSKILIIEDERDMQFILSDNLEAEGYETDSATEGRPGLTKALSGEFDLVILDLMLPDISGIEVCKLIRQQDRATPVIMVTAKGEEIDKVVGLEVGADDYITKPFGMRELLARVKAALRRSGTLNAEERKQCVIGACSVDFTSRETTGPRGTEHLTRYECDLLRFLADNRGEAVSRERILKEVWATEPETGNRTVDNYVARLRSKLEAAPSQPAHLLTVHGVGYRLV